MQPTLGRGGWFKLSQDNTKEGNLASGGFQKNRIKQTEGKTYDVSRSCPFVGEGQGNSYAHWIDYDQG